MNHPGLFFDKPRRLPPGWYAVARRQVNLLTVRDLEVLISVDHIWSFYCGPASAPDIMSAAWVDMDLVLHPESTLGNDRYAQSTCKIVLLSEDRDPN